jgi:hypothetical protein
LEGRRARAALRALSSCTGGEYRPLGRGEHDEEGEVYTVEDHDDDDYIHATLITV